MIEIKEVEGKKQLKTFVQFPFTLYGNCPYWIPPLIKEELASMDAAQNPVFKNAKARFFLAYKDGKVAGRISAIVNWVEVQEQGKSKMRFGWLDMIDDLEVTRALLNKVREWAKELSLESIEGPVGFSNLDKAGLLIEGFHELNTMVTWYNYPYYKSHLEELGLEKAAEWVEFRIKVPQGIPEKVKKFSAMIKERYRLSVMRFKDTKELISYADEMFALLNETYSKLQTFVPIQQYQIDHYKKKYLPYINSEFISCIANEEGRLVAFAITMPSFSVALKKAKGYLFPWGYWHMYRALKKNDTAHFYLIGIHPDYQSKGVTAIVFEEMILAFNRHGITEVETNPELEENTMIQALWRNYDHRLHKRRCTYRQKI